MSFINNKYFQSKHIKIFPSSFRGQYIKQGDTNQITIDPEARLNTEANFVQPKSDIGKNTYIIEYNETDKIIKFILGGYYFEISEIDKYINYLAGKELGIKLRDITLKNSDGVDSMRVTKLLDSWESSSEDILDMSTEIEQIVYYYFTGLKILEQSEASAAHIKLFNDDKSLCKEKLLPKIDHGTGDNTLIHGEGLDAAYTNQTVIGKYNDNKSTSIFEVGVGISDANRKNAVEVTDTKTTLNNNVDITNTLTTKENLIVNGTSELDGNVKIDSTTVSTNTSSGALVVAGGVGIGDGVNIANKLNVGNVLIVKKSPTTTETTVKVDGSLYVSGNSIIADSATIGQGEITLSKPLSVTDESEDALQVSGNATINKNLSVGGDTKVLEVKPTVTGIEKNVTITGTVSAGDTTVGPLTVAGTTNITGTTNIIGALNINQAVSEPSPTNINGTTNITGAININQGETTSAQDVKIKGNVEVTGKLTSTYTAYSDTDTDALTTKSYVDTKHSAAITHTDDKVNTLTLASTGGDGKYIKLISQANGQVAATESSFETTLNTSTDDNAPTSKAVSNFVGDYIKDIWTSDKVNPTSDSSTVESLKKIVMDAIYPVGSIYVQYVDKNAAAPDSCPIKIGTWESLSDKYSGHFLKVTNGSDRSTTGGYKDTSLLNHTHEYTAATVEIASSGTHNHDIYVKPSKVGTGAWTGAEGNAGDNVTSSGGSTKIPIQWVNESDGGHSHSFTLPSLKYEGDLDDVTDRNLPPYLAVYMWRRTA